MTIRVSDLDRAAQQRKLKAEQLVELSQQPAKAVQ
jgi:hypothetical protein